MTIHRASAARTRTVRLGAAAALAVAGLMTLGTRAIADPGDPNTAFSGDGYVPAALKYPSDAYVRDSGKLVTAGTTDGQLIVEKRLANGRLDTTFGTGGRFVMEDLSGLPGWSEFDSFGLSSRVLVADQGGSILVAFSIADSQMDEGTPITTAEPYLLRLTRSGRLDRSFGVKGFVEVPGRGSHYARIVDMAIDARGRITLLQQAWTTNFAGRTTGCEWDISCDNTDRALVTRLRPDGTPQLTFDGALTAEIATTWPVLIEPIALAVSGKSIVVLHRTFTGFDTGDFAVARFTTTGRRDMSYGGDGTAEIAVAAGTIAPFDITARPDGGSFVAADVSTDLRRISLIALTASGGLDSNFSADGVGQYEVGRHAYGAEVAVAPNGVAYVAGEASRRRPASPRRGFVLAVRPGGTTATTFGAGGTAWFPGATTGRADVRGIALGESGAPLFAVGTGWGDVPARDTGFVVSLQTR